MGSCTEFEHTGITNGSESVVRCFPLTGRTHQIRVHLQHLGLPIANDSCYGGEMRGDRNLPLIPHVYNGELPQTPDTAQMHSSGIYLHALTYTMPGNVQYRSRTPDWANHMDDF